MGRYRYLPIMLAVVGFTVLLAERSVLASEAWTCYTILNGKKYPTRYAVNGEILLHGDGSSHSEIIINDESLLISVATFTSSFLRHPRNASPVELDEPQTMYFVIDKSRSRLITLDSANMLFEKLMKPDVEMRECTED